MFPHICVTDARSGESVTIAVHHIVSIEPAGVSSFGHQKANAVVVVVNGRYQVRETKTEIEDDLAALPTF